jgi:hypothetical protein
LPEIKHSKMAVDKGLAGGAADKTALSVAKHPHINCHSQQQSLAIWL